MTLTDIINKLEWEVVTGKEFLSKTITGGYCSDLLSDVMGNACEGQIWITIQVHKNIIAVASLKELSAIVLVKGLTASKETIEAARDEGIVILQTEETAYETAGKLYQLLQSQ